MAFIDYEGKEVNVLASSSGLPPPEVVVRTARVFTLSGHGDLEVPVADPFGLRRLGSLPGPDLRS